MAQREPDYDVFDNLEVFEEFDRQISTEYVSYQKAQFCDYVDFDINYKFELTEICKKFVMFFKKCLIQYPDTDHQSKNSKYPEYMNYWLSNKFENKAIFKTFKNSFYQKIKNNYDKFEAEDKLRDKIFPIDNNSFINMSTLYKLYKKYHEAKGKKYTACIDFLNHWKDEYNTCLKGCYFQGNKRLCEALKKFRDNYETNKSTTKPACNGDKMNSLPDIIWLEHENLKNLILFQYNLLFENDENKKNCTMMEILHGFLQYFNANKSKSEIITFVNEFFTYYYVKNKEDYKKIFEECSTKTNTKEYCTWYNKCNEEISGNLVEVGNNLGTSLEEKVESIRKSSSEYSFMENIMSVIKDHANISTTMPTLISTIVILFLSSFFL
ncbi:hypothetical protein PVMG_05729 [Plasmodium vivax Mauritania I]|uniref:Uncharacterized protein n=1 Tax=Plasmodium vivax Mauritania I TaxID=1035515 RepID=A0A0J9T7D7_PLAVI|nr:hypothetical protein PVMG_05729 [Plasmodium vivax Mauritania I]